MLHQTIAVEQIIFKSAAHVQLLRSKGDTQTEGEIFDLLKDIGLPDNALYLIYQDRADELDLSPSCKALRCQVCHDEATGLIRTVGGRLLLTCKQCTADLTRCGALLLLGPDPLEDDDPIQALRRELAFQQA